MNGVMRFLSWFRAGRLSGSDLVGQIVEINLGSFYCYGICTHDLGKQGHVLRMFARKLGKPADDISKFSSDEPVRMVIHFPLRYAKDEPEIRLIGRRRLSRIEAKLPKFRSLGLARHDEMPKGWWIIDGDKETWVDALTHEMAGYSDDGFPNLEAIKDLYDRDLFPHSPELLCRGPLAFQMTEKQ
ncbi:hypothetical protein [Thalassovita aquimarina]|uniref:hypothetical protein n=1 Tax=Thalassovita aquimarina TaxID=2785917 RepID=UPI001BAE7A34|nr:hypothetical protein [Thalassovita aquimarina]